MSRTVPQNPCRTEGDSSAVLHDFFTRGYCPLYAECLLFNIIYLENVIKSESQIYFVFKKLNTYEYMPETYM